MSRKSFVAELWQDGVCVAAVDCPTRSQAQAEISHYALMYGQDGEVEVRWPNEGVRGRVR